MKPQNIEKEAFEFLNQVRPVGARSFKKRKLAIVSGLAVLAIAAGCFAYWYAILPRGRFTSPVQGAVVPRVFELEGYTRNIPIERRFVWVAVDVPEINLCWPHRQIYRPDEPFRVKINEQGPNRTFTVSLYAIPADLHREIREWFEFGQKTGSREGFPILPEKLRFDRMGLRLNKE